MGSAASKKKAQKVTTLATATSAFQEAGQRAANRRNDENDNKKEPANGSMGSVTNPQTDLTIKSNKSGPPENVEVSNEPNGKLSQTNPEVQSNQVPNGNGKAQTSGGSHTKAEQEEAQDNVPEMEDAKRRKLVKKNSAIKIQSVFRGYQERQQQKQQVDSATKIQSEQTSPEEPTSADEHERRFRRHLSDHNINETAQQQGSDTQRQKTLSERKNDRKNRSKAWKKGDGGKKDYEQKFKIEIGEQTKDSICTFQDEITELKWKADQQMEISMGGVGFVPPRVLLVSSKVPKGDVLPTLAHPKGVIVIHYDFDNHTCDSLLKSIERHLDAYKEGSRARTLCLYCQGGPGHLYLVKRKVVTVAKLKKETEADQVRFWKELGGLMSKITPKETKLEILGCNLMGNEKGEELVEVLRGLMKPSICRIEAPLEQSDEGRKVIESYFDFEKYKLWKNRRNSKVDGMD